MVKRSASLLYILTLCVAVLAVAGVLIQSGGENAALAADTPALEQPFFSGSVELQIEASDPVTPTLTLAVRDLPPINPDFLEYRELNPRVQRETKFDPAFRSKGGLDPLLAVQASAAGLTDRDFDTPIFNFDGAPYQGINPPDTNGDVGADHYIQMINATVVSIYDKATAGLITSFDLTDLGGCATGDGDPIVLYDQAADRWLLSEFGSGSSLCVFISQTPDPTGAYFSYQFSTPGFPDYPKYAVWPDAYYASTNEAFPAVYALARAQMLGGLPATSQRFTATSLAGFGFQALIPSDLDGATAPPAGSPNYFMRHRDDEVHNVGSNDPTEDYLEIWEFHVDFGTPGNSTFTKVADIAVTEFDSDLCGLFSFNCFPQPGSSTTLDPLREVIMWRLQYRNFGSHETLVGNLVTDVDGTDHGGVRWFELRKTGANPWTLYQEGTYAPDSVNRWMGAIAMDGSGNIALGYNVSDAISTYPGLRYVGRLAGDPLGTMPQGEYTLIAGAAANGSNRYGDYSAMSVDPVDDCTFWFTGEYNVSSQWSTRIGVFKFDACGAVAEIAVDPASLSGIQPVDVQVTHPLTITNGGLADLDWSIAEAAPLVPRRQAVETGGQLNYEAPVVTSPDQCGLYANYAGAEPAGYAKFCLADFSPAPSASMIERYPTDTAFAQDIGFVSDNFVSHALNDFPGQAVIGPNIRSIFAMDFDETATILYAIDNISRELGTYDLATGAFNPIAVVSGIPPADNISGLTIDPATGTAYVSGLGATMTLYTMDLGTAVATSIGSDATVTLLIDIAIGPQGIIYGHDIGTDTIYTIDKTTGTATPVGLTGVDSNFAQGLDFDNTDGTLYAYTYQGGGANQYGTIDLATGTLTPLAIDNPLGEFEGATQTVSGVCSTPSDIPWASVDPITGTTPAGLSTVLDVTFDSTGLSTGTYTGTLCIESNASNAPLVPVPLTMTVATYGVDLSPAQAQTGRVGTTVDYLVQITNTGDVADVFDLSASGNAWGTTLSMASIALNPGETSSFTVMVDVPAGAANNATDTATITAASQGDGTVSGTTTLTTTAQQYLLNLPIVPKLFP